MVPLFSSELGAHELCRRAVPFQVYFAVILILSLICHADIFTTSIMAGRILKTTTCHTNHSHVEETWEEVVKESMTPWLPTVRTLMFICWVPMVLQPLLALGFSIPWKDKESKDELADKRGKKKGCYTVYTFKKV